jgi:transcriptional regulator with XRE-family HTH domain
MNETLSDMPASARLGSQLRRWRVQHRIKQTHAAELFGVSQSTISRWEAGLQQMEWAERRRVAHALSARLDSAADHALARLVRGNPLPVHLICDLTHWLLACSPTRAAQRSDAQSHRSASRRADTGPLDS